MLCPFILDDPKRIFPVDKPNRRTVRLADFDYSQAGAYFVTICTYERRMLLGSIVDDKFILTNIGRIALKCWLAIPEHFEYVVLDEFVIMPNHIHGICSLWDKRVQHAEPLQSQYQNIVPGSLGVLVRSFKAAVTRSVSKMGGIKHVWQRNYWERVIRSEIELERVRTYIENNPITWSLDRENSHSEQFNIKHERYFGRVFDSK